MRTRAPTVIGLDMSLTGAAAVVLPAGWNHEPKTVKTMLTGYKLGAGALYGERLDRIVHVVDVLGSFIEEHGGNPARDGRNGVLLKPVAVFIEDYAYSKHSANTTKLAELGGALRYFLAHELGIVPQIITASRARSYLLGKIPKGKGVQKPAVQAALRSAGFNFESHDEYDAMAVANAGLAELGFAGVTFGTNGVRTDTRNGQREIDLP